MLKTCKDISMDQERLFALVRSTLPEICAGTWEPQSFSIVETRRHHRKTLVFCRLIYRDQSAQTPAEVCLVIKCYGKKSGASSTCAALQYLWQAGFDADQAYCVPRLYGYESEHGLLVQGQAAGIAWSEWLQQPPAIVAQVATQSASWLVRLQRTPIPSQIPTQRLRGTPYYCMVAPGVLAQELAASFPAHAARLEQIGEQLQWQRSQTQGLPSVLSHGDFHPRNILFTPERTTAIDFDAFGAHEAAFDVGYCIGQLLSMSYFHSGTIGPGAAAARVFWQRYALEGSASWRHVALTTACTLVQVLHYTRHSLGAASAGTLALWLDLIERWMTCEGARILTRLTAS